MERRKIEERIECSGRYLGLTGMEAMRHFIPATLKQKWCFDCIVRALFEVCAHLWGGEWWHCRLL